MDIWKVWRKKNTFFDKNIIRTNILGSELKYFGHFAYFLSAVCQNSISHNEEKRFTEKVFVVKLVQQLFSDFGDENLACLWTLQILVSSETFGQNFCLRNLFFFEMNVRFLAKLYRSSRSKTWDRVVQATFHWVSETLPGEFFLKNVHFCICFGLLEEYLQSFRGKCLPRLSKLHCSWRKEFCAEKHTLWREHNSL